MVEKKVLIYHREALFEEIAVLIAYVKEELGGVLLFSFEHDSV